ncbi:hypothetical protein AURDEDRAFT_166437 [Auricularia subglabra TFB-10046 SS5]|uniref:Uncharacterized protein n=1 Tax=Auricularia subglabra (strain TFB-10046 / SS5) TaxID=717982 RepID=J0WY08_AURST|nr:hypothetical protein AURDEDRAFT_166437 [Auricularia subglabra TFB-10046 SS5]
MASTIPYTADDSKCSRTLLGPIQEECGGSPVGRDALVGIRMEQPTNRKQGAMRCEVPDRPIDKTAPFGPCGSYDEVPPTVFRWNVVVRLCSVRGTLVAHWWLAMVGLKCTVSPI